MIKKASPIIHGPHILLNFSSELIPSFYSFQNFIDFSSEPVKIAVYGHFFCTCLWLRVHDGRKLYQFEQGPQSTSERILCLGSSRKPPVLKWEGNMAWPGKLTLTDKALYFEVFTSSYHVE